MPLTASCLAFFWFKRFSFSFFCSFCDWDERRRPVSFLPVHDSWVVVVCIPLSFYCTQVFASFYLFSFAPSENKKKKKKKKDKKEKFSWEGERESWYTHKKGHLFIVFFFSYSFHLWTCTPLQREERDKTLFGHLHRLSTSSSSFFFNIITPFFFLCSILF